MGLKNIQQAARYELSSSLLCLLACLLCVCVCALKESRYNNKRLQSTVMKEKLRKQQQKEKFVKKQWARFKEGCKTEHLQDDDDAQLPTTAVKTFLMKKYQKGKKLVLILTPEFKDPSRGFHHTHTASLFKRAGGMRQMFSSSSSSEVASMLTFCILQVKLCDRRRRWHPSQAFYEIIVRRVHSVDDFPYCDDETERF